MTSNGAWWKIVLFRWIISEFNGFHLTLSFIPTYRRGLEYSNYIPCRGVSPPPKKKGYHGYNSKLHLMVNHLFWNTRDCKVPFHCHSPWFTSCIPWRGVRAPPSKRAIINTTLNYIWWWITYSGTLVSVKYPFVATHLVSLCPISKVK